SLPHAGRGTDVGSRSFSAGVPGRAAYTIPAPMSCPVPTGDPPMSVRKPVRSAVLIAALAAVSTALSAGQVKEYKSGIVWPEPAVVTPGEKPSDPPSDAVVLFDGKDLSKWNGGEKWEVKDGFAVVRATDITTKDSFGPDYQLHVEFATPEKVEGSGQGRGN